MAAKPANPKYVAKSYEQMQYPGQHIQIDVKFVPSVCLANKTKRKRFSSYGGLDKTTIFQVRLMEHEIRHKLIRPFPDIMVKWKEVTERTMSASMRHIFSIPLRTLRNKPQELQ